MMSAVRLQRNNARAFEGIDARRASWPSFRSGTEVRRCKLSIKVVGSEVRRSGRGSNRPTGCLARRCCKLLGAEPLDSGDGERPLSFFPRNAWARALSDCTRTGPNFLGALPPLKDASEAILSPMRQTVGAAGGTCVGDKARRCNGLWGEVGRDFAAAGPGHADRLFDSGEDDDWRW